MYAAHYTRTKGFSVVEVIIAAAIVLSVVTAASAAWQSYIKISALAVRNAQAALLTEETAEALHTLRDQSWTTNIAPLTLGTTYQLYWNYPSSKYQATTSQVLMQNAFIRTLKFSSVKRDGSSNISTTTGSIDPKTLLVDVSVFVAGATSSPLMQSQMYIHNVFAN